MSVKIPAIIWESLEISLTTASKRFIKKVSEVLHVDEHELRNAVLPPGEKIKITFYDTDNIRECQAWIQHVTEPDFVVRCKKIIIPGEEYCSLHKHSRPIVQNCIEGVKTLRRLQSSPEVQQQLWLIPDTTHVVNAEGKIV